MDFEDRLFRTVHFPTNVDQLLRTLQVRINDGLRKDNPQAVGFLDAGAGSAAKFIFLETHFSRYVEIFYEEIHDLSNDYFFLYDLYEEGRLEILHSVLAARTGMTNQAINILRRSYECAILGAFLSTSSYFNYEKIKINPFVELSGVSIYNREFSNAESFRRY